MDRLALKRLLTIRREIRPFTLILPCVLINFRRGRLGGSMFHKPVHRGIPGSFTFNSVCAMQLSFTSSEKGKNFDRLKTMSQFTIDTPPLPQPTIPLDSHIAVRRVLHDQRSFYSPWASLRGTCVSMNTVSAYNIHILRARGKE